MRNKLVCNQKNREYLIFDVIACILGLGLLTYFLLTVRTSVSFPDETYYYTVPQRLLKGDSLIKDEWTLTQFVFLLDVLPYWLFTRVTGSTDGIILYMRLLFIAVDLLFYAVLYILLRKYKIWGMIGAFLFCAIVPQTIFSIAYHPVSSMAWAFTGTVLLINSKQKKPPTLVLTGMILALGVMAEPLLILCFLLWFLLTVLKAVRNKRRSRRLDTFAFILDSRTFTLVTVGAVIVFTAFITVLFFTGSFRRFADVLPFLFTDPEYNTKNVFDPGKLLYGMWFYGIPGTAGLLLGIGTAAICAIRGKCTLRTRSAIFFAGLFCLTVCYIQAGIITLTEPSKEIYVLFCQYHHIPLLLFSPFPFLLSKKRDSRLIAFLIAGLFYSVIVDISSDMVLGSGGNLVQIACLLQCRILVSELRSESVANRELSSNAKPLLKWKPGLLQATAAISLLSIVLWHGGFLYMEGIYKGPERLHMLSNEPMTQELTKGPYQGLKTTETVSGFYNDSLADLETIKAEGGRVAILDANAFTYLYLDLPYATYSSWNYGAWDREYRYWLLAPEHQPDWIYVPSYHPYDYYLLDSQLVNNRLKTLFKYLEGEKIKGKAGYIIHVTRLIPSEEE